MLLDTYEMPSNHALVPEAASNDDTSEIDLGWKLEGHQKRKEGKQKSQRQEDIDLPLVEEESKVVAAGPSSFLVLC